MNNLLLHTNVLTERALGLSVRFLIREPRVHCTRLFSIGVCAKTTVWTFVDLAVDTKVFVQLLQLFRCPRDCVFLIVKV